MGYLHIQNLYSNQEILMFRECYALEKLHGTSAHIAWKDGNVRFFSGGAKHEQFVQLFDEADLTAKFLDLGYTNVVIYGEAYGGKMQGMSGTYGKELKFIVFDIQIEHSWLAVPQMYDLAHGHFGLEVVDWVRIPTTLEAIDAERDRPSVQAVRNGCGEKPREGVVLRPLIELKKNNGERIISKHKGDAFKETATKRAVTDPDKLKVLSDAKEVAEEWVTEMRMSHVLDRLGNPGIEGTKDVILAMIEDVTREGAGEIVPSKAVNKAIGAKTAQMFKARIQASLKNNP